MASSSLPCWPAAVAACVLAGAATITLLTTGNATIQLAAGPDYRGRVTALWSMALVGSTAIGAPIIGALSDGAGPRYALALGAAACLAAVAMLISLAGFAVGGALPMPIPRSFSGDEEIADSGVLQTWPRRGSIVLGVALVAEVGFLVVWMTNSLSVDIDTRAQAARRQSGRRWRLIARWRFRMSEREFDVVVIGMGPGGQYVATKLAGAGAPVATVEERLVGGAARTGAASHRR